VDTQLEAAHFSIEDWVHVWVETNDYESCSCVKGYGMAFEISGPSVLTFPPGSTIIIQDYDAPKSIQRWSVSVTSSNMSGGYTVSISPSGLLTITIDDLNFVPPDGPIFSLQIVAVHAGQDIGRLTVAVTGPDVPCFVTGTLISTARGEVAVEDLLVGDLILTEGGGGHLPLRHVLRQTISVERLRIDATVRPVRITMGAFGELPHRDLLVSPMHRILIQGWSVELCCGDDRVLAHAAHLVDGRNVRQEVPGDAVTYHHLLLDRHAIVFSEGMPTESMFLGEMVARMLPEPDLLAIEAVIGRRLSQAPDVYPQTIYRCATRREAVLITALQTAA
jgi:Hint domain